MIKQEAKKERGQSAMPAFPEIETVSAFFTESAEAYRRALWDWQKEVSTFIADRIQQDMESLQALAEERSFPALLKVQQDWFAAVMRDYSEEGRKLMEMAGRLAAAGHRPEQTSTSSGAD